MNTAQFAVQHDSEYRAGQTYSRATFLTEQYMDRCQGRKAATGFSLYTSPCTNRATRVITAKPYTYQQGSYEQMEGPEVELHVCGTHDLMAKGNRKAAEAIQARADMARKEERQRSAEQIARHTADRINATVGSTVVEVKPSYQHGYGSYPIVIVNSAALEAALNQKENSK
jgi:hypothetical protein